MRVAPAGVARDTLQERTRSSIAVGEIRRASSPKPPRLLLPRLSRRLVPLTRYLGPDRCLFLRVVAPVLNSRPAPSVLHGLSFLHQFSPPHLDSTPCLRVLLLQMLREIARVLPVRPDYHFHHFTTSSSDVFRSSDRQPRPRPSSLSCGSSPCCSDTSGRCADRASCPECRSSTSPSSP
jgi:hypothetical protein